MRQLKGWRGVLETITTVAVLVFCLVATWKLVSDRVDSRAGPGVIPSRPVESGEAAVPIPSFPVSLEGAAVKGSASAPIALIEFSDFQCPYCAGFARETLPQLDAAYVGPGKVLVAFRHLPLPTIHPFARAAAEAAVCASAQGRFWQLHDLFFASPKQLTEPVLQAAALSAGLEMGAFRECRSKSRGSHQVEEDVKLAGHSAFEGLQLC